MPDSLEGFVWAKNIAPAHLAERKRMEPKGHVAPEQAVTPALVDVESRTASHENVAAAAHRVVQALEGSLPSAVLVDFVVDNERMRLTRLLWDLSRGSVWGSGKGRGRILDPTAAKAHIIPVAVFAHRSPREQHLCKGRLAALPWRLKSGLDIIR